MTNGEKFKGAKERAEALSKQVIHLPEEDARMRMIEGAFRWLDLEAEAEDLLPCPFCGASKNIMRETNSAGGWVVRCYTCGYRSMVRETEDAAIAAHNRVARAAKTNLQ